VSWWPFRALQAQGLHPLWATVIIYVFALLCLLLIRPGAWRDFRRYPLLWLLVLASGLTNVGFNWAVTVGDVVRVVLLFYLMPAWVAVLAWPLLGEKPGLAALLRLLLALAGVTIVLKAPGAPWPVPETLADGLALMGGFCFALTNILLRKLHQSPDASRMLAMFGGGATLALCAALLGGQQGQVALPPAPQVAWLGLAALIGLAFLAGNLALLYGAARLPAGTTALIMLTEVLFASGSSVLLGAAELSARTLMGGALILLAALWAAWPKRGA
jgi:drug/metabolite transporter (DMT)-like permease